DLVLLVALVLAPILPVVPLVLAAIFHVVPAVVATILNDVLAVSHDRGLLVLLTRPAYGVRVTEPGECVERSGASLWPGLGVNQAGLCDVSVPIPLWQLIRVVQEPAQGHSGPVLR